MTNIAQGKQGRYFWLVRPLDAQNVSGPLSAVIENCGDLFLNKYLVVTSSDSGPLRLTQQQLSKGWQRHGELALSPKVTEPDDILIQWFDEWYIFESPTVHTDLEVFVNYGTFSLVEPNPTIETMYIGSDKKVKMEMTAAVEPLRQRFWAQVEENKPESYVANGNCFTFVTRNIDLCTRVAALLESL